MSVDFVANYARHIPEIEDRIKRHQIDTLVCGIGPTAWLLPWMDQRIVRPLRIWGTHDFCRVYRADDIVLMDDTSQHLNTNGDRYKAILASRPQRFWIYKSRFDFWLQHLPDAVHGICKTVDWKVYHPDQLPPPDMLDSVPFPLEDELPCTSLVSPLGATTLAWKEGCRRIGVIGVDMLPHHHTGQMNIPTAVDNFYSRIAKEAAEKGGCIVNLSPISSLAKWRAMA